MLRKTTRRLPVSPSGHGTELWVLSCSGMQLELKCRRPPSLWSHDVCRSSGLLILRWCDVGCYENCEGCCNEGSSAIGRAHSAWSFSARLILVHTSCLQALAQSGNLCKTVAAPWGRPNPLRWATVHCSQEIWCGPVMAGCTRCSEKFFTPSTLLKDALGAGEYLRGKFDSHECHLVAKRRRWLPRD